MSCFYKIICIVVSAVFFTSATSSQTLNLNFEHYTTENGLPNNRINVIFQDHLGLLWFGTDYGLARYDGYDYQLYQADAQDSWSISGNHIRSIDEDQNGNLWIGTEFSGVNTFERDTQRFYHFRHDPSDPSSLSNDNIFDCFLDTHGDLWIFHPTLYLDKINTQTLRVTRYRHDANDSTSISSNRTSKTTVRNLRCVSCNEDRHGTIWIGTEDAGLNKYNREADNFTRYSHKAKDPHSLSYNHVSRIFEDSQHNFWIATWGGGVNLFDRESGQFTRLRHQPGHDNSLDSDFCFSIEENRNGDIWFSLDFAIDCYNPKDGTFRHYSNNRICPENYFLNRIWKCVHEDEKGNLWFRSNGGTMMLINPDTDTWQPVNPGTESNCESLTFEIVSFLHDSFGNLWMGTTTRGAYKYNPYAHNFAYMPSAVTDQLSDNNINVLYRSSSVLNSIWIGTDYGLDLYHLDTGRISHTRSIQSELHGSRVLSVLEENSRLWVGTATNGLYKYNMKTDEVTHVPFRSETGMTRPVFTVWSIFQDATDNIWILKQTKPRGLYRFNNKDTFTRKVYLDADTVFVSTNNPWCIHRESDSRFWVGMDNGLYLYNIQRDSFDHFLPDVSVCQVYRDCKNNLWLGTHQHGLGLFDPVSGMATFYDTEYGLPNNKIAALVEDSHGYLWLGTEHGLVKFDPVTKSFESFHKQHGLLSEIFLPASLNMDQNTIWMATTENGLLIFNPKDVRHNPVPPEIVFTDFRLFNESVSPGENSLLRMDITVTTEIHVQHWQNDIAVECAALHYSSPEKNQYKFWLENYDEDWYESGTNRVAAYTNLDPGEYILHATGSNSDGVWNEEGTSLRLVIHPPWWATIPAYILYILIFSIIVFVTWWLHVRRIHLRHELEMKDFEAAKLKEVDALKSQFFANMSHEFRTPLTLVLGPLEKLYSNTRSQKRRTDYAIMLRNGRRLLRLINQLLDFSKLEAGHMHLDKATVDIAYLCKSIVGSFASVADQKKIKLTLHTEGETMLIEADHDKVDKIIVNLLSNALKFTPEGGSVQIALEFISINQTDFIQIKISDTGIGIPADRLPHIFDRFYQVDDSHMRCHEGTGIGLALTKELVELHGGEITVTSEQRAGSTFTVTLPVGSVDQAAVSFEHDRLAESTLFEDVKEPEKSRPATAKPLVLIIDDNQDVRYYIRDMLSKSCRTMEAQDGLDGFTAATDKIPDLIISDVMMPGLNGFELCRTLKTDERTSHIPIILLTAKAGEENKLNGLETGADAYVIKPFEPRELVVRVKNLIHERRQLRERFRREITLQPEDIAITSRDEQFLRRAMSIIELHLSDSDFNVQTFARDVGLSHAHLHRKLRALVNMSPSQFIRSMRLKHALVLLEHHSGNIAEIAYNVGLNNPSYFAECFRKQFGKRPSDYIKTTDFS